MRGHGTILIVDDIEMNRAILCELFQSQYAILEASNGKEALELVEQYEQEITVILLDIVMPVMDGIETLRILRERGELEKLPVILITAESNESTVLEGYNMGVSDIINKPFNPDIVIRRVMNVIELYQHKRSLEGKIQAQYVILEQQAQKIKRANRFMLAALGTVVEFRDKESGDHIHHIRNLTANLLTALAERYDEYKFSPDVISMISDASVLHDIGKIAIPDAVLQKPGRLTSEEFEVIKTHTIRGCEILERLDYDEGEEYYYYSYEICRHHHERWDGSGYPDGLKGDEIPLCAQVVSLADVYEALTSERVYKKAYSHEKAVEMILGGECGTFNPRLLEAFKSVEDVLRDEVKLGESENIENSSAGSVGALSNKMLRLLEAERQKCHIFASLIGDITFDYDLQRDTLTLSEQYVETIGEKNQIINLMTEIWESSVIQEDDRKKVINMFEKLIREKKKSQIELRLCTRTGIYEYFEASCESVWIENGLAECVGVVGKLKRLDSARMVRGGSLGEARQMDYLTGVYSAHAVQELATEDLICNREGTLFFVDVDYFKRINDNFGHAYGDSLLRRLADELKEIFRKTDYVGRIGGDEFVVWLSGPAARNEVEQKALQVCELLRRIGGEMSSRWALSCSLGVASYPEDGETFSELLNNSMKAMYRAKRGGKNKYLFYQENEKDDAE